ncbi:hypothetical protein [Paenibacillus elgii]|uniref:hypothetical protein n=1 Tax=Paenibacillus elgii TaxID=189691 RepID=UPI002041A6B3|nr:hypothetical protein [Paenibacillus elgii]MCM3269971.1 hypothetical protein [Paenibacillus elgii]
MSALTRVLFRGYWKFRPDVGLWEYPSKEAGQGKKEAATRLFKDAKGREVAIPAAPQRAAVHYYAAEAISLGEKPVAANRINASLILTKDQHPVTLDWLLDEMPKYMMK